jgi:hypothetical protein
MRFLADLNYEFLHWNQYLLKVLLGIYFRFKSGARDS